MASTSVVAGPRRGTRLGARIAGWSGVLHVLLAVLAPFALTREVSQPSWDSSPETIVDFYADATFGASYKTGVLLTAVAFLLLVVLVAKVADLVGGADGGSRWVGWLIMAGISLETASGLFGYLAGYVAAVFRADRGELGADAAVSLHDLRFAFYMLDQPAMLTWMVPLGVAILVTRVFPRWVGWALLVNALLLLPAFYLGYDVWNVVSGLPSLWLLALAVMLVRRPDDFASTGRPEGGVSR